MLRNSLGGGGGGGGSVAPCPFSLFTPHPRIAVEGREEGVVNDHEALRLSVKAVVSYLQYLQVQVTSAVKQQ